MPEAGRASLNGPSLSPSDLERLACLVADRVAATAQMTAVDTVTQIASRDGRGGIRVARTWTFQRPEQVERMGEASAPWYAGWYTPDGTRKAKSCGPGPGGKRLAEKLADKVKAELTCGVYESCLEKGWDEFVQEYTSKVLSRLSESSQVTAGIALSNFGRIARPRKVSGITTAMVDGFTAARSREPARHGVGTVSPATVNSDLARLKAALNVAADWGWIKDLPRFRLLRVPRSLPVYVTPQDFALIYAACEAMDVPAGQGYTAADWWRGLLTFIYMGTGWRISQTLSLRREALDLDGGAVVSRATDIGNKARVERRTCLHPVVLEHLRKIVSFAPMVFAWPHTTDHLTRVFHRLQGAAGIRLTCYLEHLHTAACRSYGFHDLRRAFCSMNAPRLAPSELQALVGHASLQTTMTYYVNPTAGAEAVTAKLYVPEFLRQKGAG